MKWQLFEEGALAPFSSALLIKERRMSLADCKLEYINKVGIDPSDILLVGLQYKDNKANKKDSMSFLNNDLLPNLAKLGVKFLLCADSAYFKHLTGEPMSKHIGTYTECNIENYEDIKVIPLLNYSALKHNASLINKLNISIDGARRILNKESISARDVPNQYYYNTVKEIETCLYNLMYEEVLSVDIEAYSLNFWEAGIGTISFSPNQDTSHTFGVQYDGTGRVDNPDVYALLKNFFIQSTSVLVFHRGQYDLSVLIFELYMGGVVGNYKGMVEGINWFSHRIEDTLILTYVCTNNTVQNVLNLKDNTMEFSGNYAIDVKDITEHPLDVVLKYNGRDTSNTMYLYDKYWDAMVAEGQYDAYRHMTDSILVLVQCQLAGMSIDHEVASDLKIGVGSSIESKLDSITKLGIVEDYNIVTKTKAMFEANLKATNKIFNHSNFPYEFNPNSDSQVASLIHEHCGVPVIDKTKTGLPSMKVTALNMLKVKVNESDNTKTNKEVLKLLDALIEVKELSTNYTNFIKKFPVVSLPNKGEEDSKYRYLHSGINLCGTISSRPSGGGGDAGVNMLALPSTKSILAKYVKDCFRVPEGRLMVGADYTGLEDYCASVVTNDPNMLSGKLKGIDGHSMRALAYFPEELPTHQAKLAELEGVDGEYFIDESKTGLDRFVFKPYK